MVLLHVKLLAPLVALSLLLPVDLWTQEHGQLIHQITAMRAYYGLEMIPENYSLSGFATQHSWNMARAQNIWHQDLNTIPVAFNAVGENVGKGSMIWLVVRHMMDSPSHRKIILGSWSEMGYGHIRAADGNVYVTLILKI